MSITIAYCTSRDNPKFEWFFDSLERQITSSRPKIIIVDRLAELRKIPISVDLNKFDCKWTLPKPTVWQGKHRLTKEDWWAVSNSRNTALLLCQTDYILWVDDRCVLAPGWLAAAQEADEGGYAVCGSYEKRHGMAVENGGIVDFGTLNSEDGRKAQSQGRICKAPGQWFFGGTLGCTLEMALVVNGFDESMDSLSAEDCLFGMHLENNGFKIMHDPRLKIIEDRTPGECGPDMKRSSKEKHPKDVTDKGHEAFRRFGRLKRASHIQNLSEHRAHVLAGNPFWGHNNMPSKDWFDGQPLSEM